MMLNDVHLVMLGTTLVLNLIVLCPMLERILVRFLVAGSFKLSLMVILTFTAFCFLNKNSSRYSGTKRENSEFKKKTSCSRGGTATQTLKPFGL